MHADDGDQHLVEGENEQLEQQSLLVSPATSCSNEQVEHTPLRMTVVIIPEMQVATLG